MHNEPNSRQRNSEEAIFGHMIVRVLEQGKEERLGAVRGQKMSHLRGSRMELEADGPTETMAEEDGGTSATFELLQENTACLEPCLNPCCDLFLHLLHIHLLKMRLDLTV